MDVMRTLQAGSVHCVVTSPPYWGLRQYSTEPQVWGGDPNCHHEFGETTTRARVGWESTPAGQKQFKSADSSAYHTSSSVCVKCSAWRGELGGESLHDCLSWARGEICSQCFICHLRMVFAEVWRILRPDGTLWVNIGDSYSATGKGGRDSSSKTNKAKKLPRGSGRWGGGNSEVPGLKAKNLCGIPQRFALAMQMDGWFWRSDICWEKPSAMPESCKDRPTRSHEPVYLFTKSAKYFYDHVAVQVPAKQSSLERLGRAVSDNHKLIDGAPGQEPHGINRRSSSPLWWQQSGRLRNPHSLRQGMESDDGWRCRGNRGS